MPEVGGQHLTETKTGTERVVALGQVGVEALRQYRANVAERLAHEPDEWLISHDGQTPMRAKSVTAAVTRLGTKVGVPLHLRQLRYFAATYLVGRGMGVRTISARLGHASTQMTLDTYTHAIAELDLRAADMLGAAHTV